MDPIISDPVAGYLTELAATEHSSEVLSAMEERAEADGFPIVGRAVGRFLELMARSVGARRVLELGSGYGYSAYWFARAVGEGGEVVCTEMDADLAADGEAYLERAGLAGPVRYRVGEALEGLAAETGDFDVIFCDADKDAYPDCWRAARDRLRVGGLYLCDNVLWYGLVVTGQEREGLEGWTARIREHNRLVAEDPDYAASIIPLRDGVLTALRTD